MLKILFWKRWSLFSTFECSLSSLCNVLVIQGNGHRLEYHWRNNECIARKIMRMASSPCGSSEKICRHRHSIHLFKNKGMVFMPKQDGFSKHSNIMFNTTITLDKGCTLLIFINKAFFFTYYHNLINRSFN